MSHDTANGLEADLRSRLAPSGLLPLGWLEIDGRAALLIGNTGSSQWAAFSKSDAYADGLPDPMNRWTEAVISELVAQLPTGLVDEVRFPFGEAVWPFQLYAQQAMGIQQSPIGLLIHPDFGLWMAYRAVVVLAESFAVPQPESLAHPCDTCIDKPCLNTCPINAFTLKSYDYLACKAHVASSAGKACFDGGCLARRACPVGQTHHYEKPHQNFHMKAYV